MNKQQEKQARLARRHRRVRGKISGTAARPRLCVTRSNSNMYVQVIDDVAHTTICGVSFVGPILIVGTAGEDFSDLTEQQEHALRAMGVVV